MSAAPRMVLLVVCALLFSACKVDSRVAVEVREDGSGTVTFTVAFDADAVDRVPDLESGLQTADLTAAGWQVEASSRSEAGVTYTAVKPFVGVDELRSVLTELTGPEGFLRDVDLQRTHSFGSTTWTFTATADLSKGVAVLSDAQLAAALGGRPLGRDQAALEKELGAPLASFVTAALSVTLPDDVQANTTQSDGRTATWTLTMGDEAPHVLSASSTDEVWQARAWAYVAGGAAFALIVVLVVQSVRRRRPILRAVDNGSV